jgi:hypothetical protein
MYRLIQLCNLPCTHFQSCQLTEFTFETTHALSHSVLLQLPTTHTSSPSPPPPVDHVFCFEPSYFKHWQSCVNMCLIVTFLAHQRIYWFGRRLLCGKIAYHDIFVWRSFRIGRSVCLLRKISAKLYSATYYILLSCNPNLRECSFIPTTGLVAQRKLHSKVSRKYFYLQSLKSRYGKVF